MNGLGGGVFSVWADVGRVEAEHDIVFRNASADKFPGDGEVGIIGLNPDLTVNDFEMNHKVVNPPKIARLFSLLLR